MRYRTIKKIIATISCLLFTFSLFILVANLHFHVANNSFLVSHSHPYNKSHHDNSPVKSHHHSNLEFLIYNSIATNDGLFLLLFTILIFLILIKYLFFYADIINHINSAYQLPILRAPPFMFQFNQ